MKIETKFDVGDYLFGLVEDGTIYAQVTSIEIFVMEAGDAEIYYTCENDKRSDIYVSENWAFATMADLMDKAEIEGVSLYKD